MRKLKQQGITTAIVIPDMQIPYHNKKAVAAVEQLMADMKFDWYINLGDFIDVEGISHYSKGKPRLTMGKELVKEYKTGNEVLDRHQKLIRKNNKDAQFHYILGNHEERVEAWLDENPALTGLIEVPEQLRLAERGFTWTRDGHMGNGFQLGKALFTHGDSLATFHTQKMAQQWGENVFYGHIHDVQSFTMTTRKKNSTRIAQSMGCLCVYDLPYVDKKPTRWQNAFGIFFFRPDGTFNHYVVNIVKDKFIWNGKQYGV